MTESIEQLILRILNQVSEQELLRNRGLRARTIRVLRALECLKVSLANNKNYMMGV